MRRLTSLAAILVTLLVSLLPSPLHAQAQAAPDSAYNAHPKLVLIVVIDQFRADMLERYRSN